LEASKIQAVIFDLDGLLIDSEPLWQEAEIEVFGSLGVPLTLEMCHETHGLRIDRVVEHWFARAPWGGVSHAEVGERIIAQFLQLLNEKGTAMPGATEIVRQFADRKVPVGIASSSMLKVIEAAVDKLDIRECITVMHSAEFEEHGKPDPGVYLTAARMLEVEPKHVIAFEDSAVGVEAAFRAGMRCIMVPDQIQPDSDSTERSSFILNSLNDFSFQLVEEFLAPAE
jgi:sugar-phosphatase